MTRYSQIVAIVSQIVAFNQQYRRIAITVWAFSLLASMFYTVLMLSPRDSGAFLLLWTLLFAEGISGVISYKLSEYEKSLQKRMSADGEAAGKSWKVSMGEGAIHDMPDAEYASILHSVHFDGALYLSQLANIFVCISNLISRTIASLPMLVFWGLVAFVLCQPTTLAEMVTIAQHATMADIANTSVAITSLIPAFLFAVGFVVFLAETLFGSQLGFNNRFEEALYKKLRKRLGHPLIGMDAIVMTRDKEDRQLEPPKSVECEVVSA